MVVSIVFESSMTETLFPPRLVTNAFPFGATATSKGLRPTLTVPVTSWLTASITDTFPGP